MCKAYFHISFLFPSVEFRAQSPGAALGAWLLASSAHSSTLGTARANLTKKSLSAAHRRADP